MSTAPVVDTNPVASQPAAAFSLDDILGGPSVQPQATQAAQPMATASADPLGDIFGGGAIAQPTPA